MSKSRHSGNWFKYLEVSLEVLQYHEALWYHMSHVGWLVGKLFAGSLEHGVGVPQDGGLQGVLQGGGGPQGVPALVRRGGGSWSVVPHWARAPVVKIFKFRAQALLLGLSLGLDKKTNWILFNFIFNQVNSLFANTWVAALGSQPGLLKPAI